MLPKLPAFLLFAAACGSVAAQSTCSAQSPARRTPVIELYTSEGCSSCPPADRWLATLNGPAAAGRVVVEAFHVGYWDSLGWVDRFAAPAHTQRQRELAAANRLSAIYTPQVVRNGIDWRDYARTFEGAEEPAQAAIRITRTGDRVEAQVTTTGAWTAYWTVTEHGHASKVTAGENDGETLRHDFVVRQYVPLGRYQGAQQLAFRPIPATPGHAQQVNLVVTDARSGRPLQALSLTCP